MTIAATIPALRPLWAKSARRNLKTSRPARTPDDQKSLKPTYVVMDRHSDANSVASCLVTAQEGKIQGGLGSESTPPFPDRARTLHTSDVGVVKNYQQVEGIWTLEQSSFSHLRERGVEDVV